MAASAHDPARSPRCCRARACSGRAWRPGPGAANRVSHTRYVAVSPYRLGELPNLHVGIASVTSSSEAVEMYKGMTEALLKRASTGEQAKQQLQALLAKL